MAIVRLFAQAREAAGTSRAEINGATVGEVIDAAVVRFGRPFSEVLTTCRVWLNGEDVPHDTPVRENDEVAVLPPVSGGAE